MKKSDETKKVLEHCIKTGMGCHMCDYLVRCLKVVRGKPIMQDALALIQQLETELAAVKRERDAAVRDIKLCAIYSDSTCKVCKNGKNGRCRRVCLVQKRFEWRGVCSENTEAKDENNATKG